MCVQMDETTSLKELTRMFFSRRFQYQEPETPIRGRSGHKWTFDAIVTFKEHKYGLFVREWNRSIGVNQIRQLEKACRDTKCAGGIIVGDIFSSNAEIYGENLGIQIIDRAALMTKLRNF